MDDEFYADDYFQDKNGTDGEDGDEYDGNVENLDQYKGDATMAVLNPKSVKERIDETLEILANLKSRTDVRLSRKELLSTLAK